MSCVSTVSVTDAALIFAEADVDGSGYLGFRELAEALRTLWKRAGITSMKPDFATLEKQFAAADANNDNKVSLPEFMDWYNYTVDWVERLLESEAERQKSQGVAKVADSRRKTLNASDTKALVQIKSSGSKPTRKDGADAKESNRQVRAAMDVASIPHFSDTERSRLRDIFMASVAQAEREHPVDHGGDAVAERLHDRQQGSAATAVLTLHGYLNFFRKAFGTSELVAGSDWIRERAYSVQCRLAGEPYGRLTFQGLMLWLRPALKGNVVQASAAAFFFYDFDQSGLLAAAEVMELIERQPIGSHDERDLLHLLTMYGGRRPHYDFAMYRQHAEEFGIHGTYLEMREKLLDKAP